MTRHPEKAAALVKAGAEVVQGDLTNHAVLQLALRGVNGVFAMSTPFEAGMEAECSLPFVEKLLAEGNKEPCLCQE